MASMKPRPETTEDTTDDLDHWAEAIRRAEDFESMRGMLGELPPGIFPPAAEFGFRRRRRGPLTS